ncbi:MAG: hypothetical protein ACE3JK_11900 [Sporolactobacillus sp.]
MSFWRELFRDRVKVTVLTGYSEAAHWVYIENSDNSGEIYIALPNGKKRICRPIAINWLNSSPIETDLPVTGAFAGHGEGVASGTVISGEMPDNSTAYVTVWDYEANERMTWCIDCTAAQYQHIKRLFNRATRSH